MTGCRDCKHYGGYVTPVTKKEQELEIFIITSGMSSDSHWQGCKAVIKTSVPGKWNCYQGKFDEPSITYTKACEVNIGPDDCKLYEPIITLADKVAKITRWKRIANWFADTLDI